MQLDISSISLKHTRWMAFSYFENNVLRRLYEPDEDVRVGKIHEKEFQKLYLSPNT